MRKLPWGALAIAAMLAAPAWADTPNGTTGTAAAPQADPNEMVCKQSPSITGTRFPGPQVCLKRMIWEQMQRTSNEGLQGRMNKMSPANTSGGYSDGDR